jgi:hypothetical protein
MDRTITMTDCNYFKTKISEFEKDIRALNYYIYYLCGGTIGSDDLITVEDKDIDPDCMGYICDKIIHREQNGKKIGLKAHVDWLESTICQLSGKSNGGIDPPPDPPDE